MSKTLIQEKRKLLISIINGSKISRVLARKFSYRTYGNIVYNETLFSQYGETHFSQDINFISLGIKIETKLGVIKEILFSLQDYFYDDDFILRSIQEKIELIELIILSLPFELEKAGFQLSESGTVQQKRIKKIEQIEERIFGKKISENHFESSMCLSYIQKKYALNSHLLNKIQKKKFHHHLTKIENNLSESFPYYFPKILKESCSFHFFRNYGNILIPKQDYLKIFRNALDISGMKDYKILIWNNGNIAITRENLLIPESSSYNELSLERVLRVMTHEIMVHGICWKNQKRFFGKIKGENFSLKEEGLAMYMESRMLGENPKTINLKPYASARILAGEILDGKEFYSFIELFRTLTKQKTSSVKKSYLRHKSGHSHIYPGVNREDISYMRGLSETQEYLLENKQNILPLFAGKLSFSDAKNIGSTLIQEQKFVKPINISDYIIYELSQCGKYKNFQEYIEKKYFDIYTAFNDMESLPDFKKQKLREIVNIILPYIHG